MLRIAICDDDNSAVAAHKKIAEACLLQSGSAGEIFQRIKGIILRIRHHGHFYIKRKQDCLQGRKLFYTIG